MELLFYVKKIKYVLFSKFTCVYQATFFCMKCPLQRRTLFQKDILEKRCAVVKTYRWHMEKIIIYWENYHVTKQEILFQVFEKK